jgi:ribosomal protein L13E
MKLVNATTIAAEQTRHLGITRDDKRRRSTLLSLEKIRDYLGE